MADPNGSIDVEYAKQFWSLANAITAFAVLQALTYLYAVGASDSKIVGSVLSWRRLVALCIALISLLYCVAILVLGYWEGMILQDHHLVSLTIESTWVMYARLLTVALVGFAASILTLLGKDPRETVHIRRAS